MIPLKIFMNPHKIVMIISVLSRTALRSLCRTVLPFCFSESQKASARFKECLDLNTEQSLEEGAKLLASLEVEVENNEAAIMGLQEQLDECSGEAQEVIKKIQKILENIELEKDEIESIEMRTQKEIADCKNYSISKVAKEILDVADSLTRAQQHSENVHGAANQEMVASINKAVVQMEEIFKSYGIESFDPIGEHYDPNKQEALANTPTPQGKEKSTVAHTMRSGYMIKGRLLRSAHVAIYS